VKGFPPQIYIDHCIDQRSPRPPAGHILA